MSKIINISDHEDSGHCVIDDEARNWLVRLDVDRPESHELNEFREWLERSPYHREAFKKTLSVWNQLDDLAYILDILPAERESRSCRNFQNIVFGFRFSWPLAASILLLIGLGGLLATFLNPLGHGQAEIFIDQYQTAVGEQQAIELPDGSSMRINTNSRINVAYKDKTRIIRIIEGEAWFDVYHNEDKPFIVYAGRYIVRAVGTAFSVRVYNGKIDLTVTDGRVEVTSLKETLVPEAMPEPAGLELASFRAPVVAGQHMRLDDTLQLPNEQIELVQKIKPQQLDKQLSWRDGILIFDNDTLEDVVNEINRYTNDKIVISDPQIRDLRFGGFFRASDVGSILATLEKRYDIRAEIVNPGLIHLSKKQ